MESKLAQFHNIKPRRWPISFFFPSRSQQAKFANNWLRFTYIEKPIEILFLDPRNAFLLQSKRRYFQSKQTAIFISASLTTCLIFLFAFDCLSVRNVSRRFWFWLNGLARFLIRHFVSHFDKLHWRQWGTIPWCPKIHLPKDIGNQDSSALDYRLWIMIRKGAYQLISKHRRGNCNIYIYYFLREEWLLKQEKRKECHQIRYCLLFLRANKKKSTNETKKQEANSKVS